MRLPPSPPKLPIIGHLHRLGKLPHRSLQALSEKYGPLMLLRLGQTPTVIVSSANLAKEIMKTHDVIFANRPITTATKELFNGNKDIAFAPYGEYWRNVRKIVVMDLLSVKRVQSFRYIREEEIGKMLEKIRQSSSLGSGVDVSELIVTVTNNLISRVTLGKSWEVCAKYADLPKQVMELIGNFSVEDLFPSLGWIDVLTGLHKKMKRVSKAMSQFLDEVIDEHLKSRKDEDDETRDFVDLLIKYHMDPTLGCEITRENLRALIFDLFVGGTDSTSTTTEWILAELFHHPEVLKKLQNEVRTAIGTESMVDEDDTNRMEYMHCVIKETLRLHPPLTIIIPRVPTENTTIDGYHIPAQTRVIINAWAIARDPKIWDNPDQFIPERFINNQVDFRGQDFEFIPFGAGRRICPGILFSVTSMASILANLLYWFDWDLPNGVESDVTEIFGLTNHKKDPLRLVPTVHAF
ncbi:hypothetical protein IFM89_008477 [Coptis chinensis]|uniref:Cytochrome P450 n=1 Tax=Coptis chinensis TaxID=261450 RepID=A0A835H4X5_9MAGN|nr:hypothetical protein IFM89_008477 [Coptis chinensis]